MIELRPNAANVVEKERVGIGNSTMGGPKELDLAIIGAGPGGVQVALTLGEIKRRTGANFSYRILEQTDAPGAFFTRFPVHGQLISNNKLYTGRDPKSRFSERYDWNSLITDDRAVLTRDFSREFFPRREVIPAMLANLCERYAVPVTYNVGVTKVARDCGAFLVESEEGPIVARYVVAATGLKPWTAPIPGIELTTPYAAMKPREHYRDKRVLIIGKGNSGFECAKDILNEASIIMLASPSPARLAYQTHYVGSVRNTNAILVENYQLKHQAALLNCMIRQITRAKSVYQATVAYTNAQNEVETLEFDEVIAATGFTGNLDTVIDSIGLSRLHGKFPEIDGMFQSRAIPGLFFAGALTHGPDYRSFSSSGFIHGFRYNSMILARHLAEMLGANEPRSRIAPDDLSGHLLEDFEEDAGMYLQPGHIGRCYRRTGNGTWIDLGHQTRQWYQEQPIDDDTLLLATLEYGDIHSFPNALQIPRYPGDPDRSAHIHPVVRLRGPDGSKELNLEENLLNRYIQIPANRLRLEPLLSS
jgi:thioredoxin reductase